MTTATDTLRRCIGVLQACEDILRADLESLRNTKGNQSMDHDMREALAELAVQVIADARAEHQRLQAAAIGGAA